MSVDEFLSFLQLVLTLIDPKDSASVDLGRVALITLSGLIRKSNKPDDEVLKIVETATNMLGQLIAHSADFAVVRGDTKKTHARRQMLAKVLSA